MIGSHAARGVSRALKAVTTFGSATRDATSRIVSTPLNLSSMCTPMKVETNA